MIQVRVLAINGGKIQLTMKSEEDRKQEADMSGSGVGAGSSKKARNTLEAALARVGFKHTPEQEPEVITHLRIYLLICRLHIAQQQSEISNVPSCCCVSNL